MSINNCFKQVGRNCFSYFNWNLWSGNGLDVLDMSPLDYFGDSPDMGAPLLARCEWRFSDSVYSSQGSADLGFCGGRWLVGH